MSKLEDKGKWLINIFLEGVEEGHGPHLVNWDAMGRALCMCVCVCGGGVRD